MDIHQSCFPVSKIINYVSVCKFCLDFFQLFQENACTFQIHNSHLTSKETEAQGVSIPHELL